MSVSTCIVTLVVDLLAAGMSGCTEDNKVRLLVDFCIILVCSVTALKSNVSFS